MSIKPITIAVAALVLILQWPTYKYERADEKLGEFYSQIASANFTAARESIEEAIRLWPSNARYYTWRAYLTSQQLPSQCLRQSKSTGDNRSMSSLDLQSSREAVADYRHALELNRRDAVAHHNLAWLEHLLGDNTHAADDWKQSTEIDPDNAVFHLSYGMLLEESGDTQAGREQYETAIELAPSILDSQFFIRYHSRYPAAADAIVAHCTTKMESRLQQGDDPILEARLGKLYLYSGSVKRATQLLEDAARQLPNLPLVWFNLGESQQLQGNNVQAMTYYKRANVIDASLARTYLRMGEISLHSGDRNDAIRDLNVALQRWQHMNPITAAHNNRLYGGPRQTIDDLLPTTLVWYVSPCEASESWRALSQLFPQKSEYAKRVRACEELPAPHADLE